MAQEKKNMPMKGSLIICGAVFMFTTIQIKFSGCCSEGLFKLLFQDK